MDNPSAISDPKTGESLSGGPNTPEACAQRLRISEALRIMDLAGPEIEEYAMRLMQGEDVDPSEYAHLIKDGG